METPLADRLPSNPVYFFKAAWDNIDMRLKLNAVSLIGKSRDLYSYHRTGLMLQSIPKEKLQECNSGFSCLDTEKYPRPRDMIESNSDYFRRFVTLESQSTRRRIL